MLQLQVGDTGIIVLEPENVRQMQAGHPMRIPVEQFNGNLRVLCLDYTNDAEWLAARIAELIQAKGDPRKIPDLIQESAKRPEPPLRPLHPMLDFLAGGSKGNA